MPYAPELRSLRGRIQGAPPIRMGGPTEQYRRSRGQQKSFGLGQLYGQPAQAPEFTGWQPGPLQLDPIRKVTGEPTLGAEREEEERRLRMRSEIQEEFAAPPREQARRDRLKREFIEEQEQADKLALEARQREEKQRKESVVRGNLAQMLHGLLVETGMPQQEANVAATQAVVANRAEDEIERLQKQKADIATAEAKRLREGVRTTGALEAAKLARTGQQPTQEQQRRFLETGARTPAGLISSARARRRTEERGDRQRNVEERTAEWRSLSEGDQAAMEAKYREAELKGDSGAGDVLRRIERFRRGEERALELSY